MPQEFGVVAKFNIATIKTVSDLNRPLKSYIGQCYNNLSSLRTWRTKIKVTLTF